MTATARAGADALLWCWCWSSGLIETGARTPQAERSRYCVIARGSRCALHQALGCLARPLRPGQWQAPAAGDWRALRAWLQWAARHVRFSGMQWMMRQEQA